jgi:hypothetical protein
MRNRVSLAQLSEMPIKEAAKLPIEQLAMLLEEMTEMKAETKRLDSLLHSVFVARFTDIAAEVRSRMGKDVGTVRIKCDDYTVIADLPKDVEWDQGALKKAVDTIASYGEPIEDYVTVKYSVPETKYNAWPESIKTVFAPARTVGTGKPTFKIEKGKV